MHDDARAFVEHEQMVILKKNFQRDVFRQRLGGDGLGPFDGDCLARARVVGGFGRLAVHAHVAVFDEALEGAARGFGEVLLQKLVQPRLGLRFFDVQCLASAHTSFNGRSFSLAHKMPPATSKPMLMIWPGAKPPSVLPRGSSRRNSMPKRMTA